jgi:hypothetical protein
MAAAEQWVPIQELARIEGLSSWTIRDYATRRLITCRRRGIGKRAPLEFPVSLAHQQLSKLRERDGISVANTEVETPTNFQLVQEVRDMRVQLEKLMALVRSQS